MHQIDSEENYSFYFDLFKEKYSKFKGLVDKLTKIHNEGKKWKFYEVPSNCPLTNSFTESFNDVIKTEITQRYKLNIPELLTKFKDFIDLKKKEGMKLSNNLGIPDTIMFEAPNISKQKDLFFKITLNHKDYVLLDRYLKLKPTKDEVKLRISMADFDTLEEFEKYYYSMILLKKRGREYECYCSEGFRLGYCIHSLAIDITENDNFVIQLKPNQKPGRKRKVTELALEKEKTELKKFKFI